MIRNKIFRLSVALIPEKAIKAVKKFTEGKRFWHI
jgi:hypothetical protein